MSVLYGGSVNAKNHKELRQSSADGFLMGGVSLKLDDFIQIIINYRILYLSNRNLTSLPCAWQR